MAALEAEFKAVDEENKALSSEIKTCNTGIYLLSLFSIEIKFAELSKLKATPSDLEVDSQMKEIAQTVRFDYIVQHRCRLRLR